MATDTLSAMSIADILVHGHIYILLKNSDHGNYYCGKSISSKEQVGTPSLNLMQPEVSKMALRTSQP